MINLNTKTNEVTFEEGYSKMFANTYQVFLKRFAEANNVDIKLVVKTNNENPEFRKELGDLFLEAIKVGLTEEK
jgi:hypothetical protein